MLWRLEGRDGVEGGVGSITHFSGYGVNQDLLSVIVL